MTLDSNRRSDGDSSVRDVRLDDGGIIIYDPDNEEAWIQADHAVPFG